MINVATLNYRQIKRAIANREEFKGNSMWAVLTDATFAGTGYLSAELQKELKACGPDTYIVYSYSTPIAWVNVDGDITIPDTKYSVTTSRQQGIVRSYL
jgi:hypothetical protein